MQTHGLNVYEEKKTRLEIDAQYVYRGYNHSFTMLWSLVKAETEIYLANYFNIDLNQYC